MGQRIPEKEIANFQFVERIDAILLVVFTPAYTPFGRSFAEKKPLLSTRHLGLFLCKNCGTICIFPLKSAKTDKNQAKNSKITRRSTIFKVFRRYFMPLRSVMPVLAAFRSVLLFLVLCPAKKLAKQHPTGFEYF